MSRIRLDPAFVQAVRDALDPVDLVSQYTELTERGGRWVGLCPFHQEKTPSFS
ncbi:MAG: CHC2 zinc finger domain-containing protein, partial [Acidobacteriota bacterium]